MNKIATGPEAAHAIDITLPIGENIKRVAKAKHKSVEDVTVIVLDRPRHEQLIADIRKEGARIRLISDGDIAGALMTCKPDAGIDILAGIGGSPEAVVSACALKCVGGAMFCTLWPRNEEESQKCREHGMDLEMVFGLDDLVKSDNVFFAATGVTNGELLQGVRYEGDKIRTQSIVMRSASGTIRYIEAIHKLSKLEMISGIDY
jgi:fructose-1,6-bisphosphatase II